RSLCRSQGLSAHLESRRLRPPSRARRPAAPRRVPGAMSRLALAWERFWFRPAEPGNLIAARVILAGAALWILLSRPGLPDLLSWPAACRAGFDPAVTWRFLHFGQPPWAEKALFVVLLLCLACVLAGLRTRWAAVCSALLLYHFAPLMDPLHTRGGPYFLG